ncbi:4Fe-4S dicluster domain-containing protein [Aestuariivita sp.]|jgi:ferredoxin|uniref:4Fe-4S dicluster domain-containing protein n=1 Tax=Aestuariivita sp. TaxID=1872407 RepID=UPI00216F1E38|nr:4Fe-4S dicluster domain-containing protein [Aestuariivita sp.]MCE8006265.1 4Fe-4S dicluster domain-containing protein [Aestuariivita sp.]
MPRANPYRPFTPDPKQSERVPEISGNAINGLGDTTFRRPDVVYWAPDPATISHGPMQDYFYMRSNEVDGFAKARARRLKINEAPLPPIADSPAQRSPRNWTTALERFVQSGLCEKVGVTEMNPDWAYAGQTVTQTRVIIAGVQHAYDAIQTAPAPEAGLEVVRQYTRAGAAAKAITAWLHEQGWAAEAVTGPLTGSITLIPPALACGFGELGKHGSIINPEMGASFRLSAVLTDAPFAPTPRQSHGVDDFCQNCRICEDACPPEALSPDKQTVRGETKWYVDFDKCVPFFNETHGCAICIAVCPWSRPGVGLNLAAKLARRAQRKETA